MSEAMSYLESRIRRNTDAADKLLADNKVAYQHDLPPALAHRYGVLMMVATELVLVYEKLKQDGVT